MRVFSRVLSLAAASALGVVGVVGASGAAAAAATVGPPVDLTTAGQPCATEAPGPYLSPELLNDADAVIIGGSFTGAATEQTRADYEVWDVAEPGEIQQWSDTVDERRNRFLIQLDDPPRQLDGVTYAWRVRLDDGDGGGATPWSGTCYFTVDRTGGPAVTVASEQYPAGDWGEAHGEVGAPGTFTFTSASDDTVKYEYRFYSGEAGGPDDYSTVEATRLGGPASISWTPVAAGYHSVAVFAFDRAGNASARETYEFQVSETQPSVFSAAYPQYDANLDYNVGVPGAFQFDATLAGTASFAWRIDGGGPSGTIAADSAGDATAMIAPTRAGEQTLYVRSVTADGTAHPERAYRFRVDNGPRAVDGTYRSVMIGSTLAVAVQPRTPAVKAYVYWTENYSGTPSLKHSVPARPDGSAELSWTATTFDVDRLLVQSRDASGALSEARAIQVGVGRGTPDVTRTGGDVLGTTATFTARTDMVDPATFEAVFNGNPATKQVLTPAADGTVTFQFTPSARGYNYVSVVARNAAGVATDSGGTYWTVRAAAR